MQFLTYALVGGTGTLLHFLLLTTSVELLNFGPLISSVVGSIIAALFNHHFNRKFTFNSSKTYFQTLVGFLSVAIFMMIANFCLMYCFLNIVSLHYLIAQVLSTAIVFLLGYTSNKLVVFAHRR